MIGVLLGVVAFALLMLTIGAVAEHNSSRAFQYGLAFAVCSIAILVFTEPEPVAYADCWIDWDGRSNATVCN